MWPQYVTIFPAYNTRQSLEYIAIIVFAILREIVRVFSVVSENLKAVVGFEPIARWLVASPVRPVRDARVLPGVRQKHFSKVCADLFLHMIPGRFSHSFTD